MAEITQTNAAAHSGRKVRAKKLTTKMDMTPMVDLAFLLLTFFILTTTFLKSNILRIDMPDKTSPPTPVNDERILNLVLAENNKLYWWMGLDDIPKTTNYSRNGVRKLLLEKRKANPKIMVLIKPHDKAKYENIVDILDEVEIVKMERYAIIDFTEDDKAKIQKTWATGQ
ncbi:MAG: ExbD/TolR family protein [Bacteroidota bacterium]